MPAVLLHLSFIEHSSSPLLRIGERKTNVLGWVPDPAPPPVDLYVEVPSFSGLESRNYFRQHRYVSLRPTLRFHYMNLLVLQVHS